MIFKIANHKCSFCTWDSQFFLYLFGWKQGILESSSKRDGVGKDAWSEEGEQYEKQWKQAAAVMMAASMAAGLAGCGGGNETKETQAGKSETAAAGETTAQAEPSEFSYPMEKEKRFSTG